ncbi:MAG: NifB/NifX family molybdenum-iron cluster-binding protein [Betaproteobacteria bacterium]
MKICMPVDQINGLDSQIAPNFRAAPTLMLIDSVSRECQTIDATGGACGATPQQIDAIICAGGMGRGMFNGLRSRGIKVFNSDAKSVAEALAELTAGSLEEVLEVECCGGGHHEQGENHKHQDGHSCGCNTPKNETSSGCGCSHH